jgi:hypothetical protein
MPAPAKGEQQIPRDFVDAQKLILLVDFCAKNTALVMTASRSGGLRHEPTLRNEG